jgi:ferric-dicitrate binding protein FerR (iron transport regulator)
MNPPENKLPEERFEEAWQRWAQRPPRQSPAEAAARVGALIRERQRRRKPRWALTAVAAVLFIAIALGLHWSRLSTPPPLRPVTGIQDSPRLGEGEVLMWIDTDTPLYMTFQPPEGGASRGGKP